ncbi:Uu.00g112530.m01.CDS01 [Anthostomella pinea]|uniref:Uu.00g112530.m01.CDS01 n=1 Tax=Anthostomella pinea TaxID=933095 RepID=A0AAI8VF90_9PEZI|nr:Uu.00g112530.m01.CDS01 [Anthostomella pinea]
MKLSAALSAVAFSSWALAAPMLMAGERSPSRLQSAPRITFPSKPAHQVSLGEPTEHHSILQDVEDSTSLHSLGEVPIPKTLGAYRRLGLFNLLSLSHRRSTNSPLSDSTIMREETRANTIESESAATIVELETKAASDSYAWVPCRSQTGALHYHLVRRYADALVVSLVLGFIAVVLVIELWSPASQKIRQYWTGHGAIYLEGEGRKTNQSRQVCVGHVFSALEIACEEKPKTEDIEDEKGES